MSCEGCSVEGVGVCTNGCAAGDGGTACGVCIISNEVYVRGSLKFADENSS